MDSDSIETTTESAEIDDGGESAEQTHVIETPQYSMTADGVDYSLRSDGDSTSGSAFEHGEQTLLTEVAWTESRHDASTGTVRISGYDSGGGDGEHLGRLVDSTELDSLQHAPARMELSVQGSDAGTTDPAVASALEQRGYSLTEQDGTGVFSKRIEADSDVPTDGTADRPVEAQDLPGADPEAVGLSSRLESTAEEIRGADHEQLVAIDGEGRVLWQEAGDEGGVDFGADRVDAARDAEVLMHNHPSGVAFSGDDVATAYQTDVGEMRVVGPGGETYSLRPPEGQTFRESAEGNPVFDQAIRSDLAAGKDPGEVGSVTRERITTLHANLENEHRTSMRENITRRFMDEDTAAHKHHDDVMRDLSERLGLRYESEF